MLVVCWILFLTGVYPLYRAWRGNRRTTLLHALNWCFAAWLAWIGVLAFAHAEADVQTLEMGRLLALSLTGCAGVAVLGARRPGVEAWNFVVMGLLAVLLLPWFESLLVGRKTFDGLRAIFVPATLLVCILNYLPTRFGPGALLLAISCAWECWLLINGGQGQILLGCSPGWLGVALTPWVALACWKTAPPPRSEFDGLWLDFRNRFGVFWAQRVRDQFNRAAANAGWLVYLSWQGLTQLATATAPPPSVEDSSPTMLETLQALLKRFRTDQ